MKLLKVLVAALVLVGMVVPAIAEDRLQLSGEMRVRGWHADNSFDGDEVDSTRTWADQRLRIGGKIAVAEGVSITFRTDVTEANWGGNNAPESANDFGNGRTGNAQQWDRAHIDLAKGNFHLRAGQQYVGYGKTFAVDAQEAGLSMNLVGAVPFNAFALLDNDNGAASDAFLYGLAISPKGDTWSSQLFAAGQSKRLTAEEEAYVIGANGAFDLGAIKLIADIAFFTGDHSDTVDAMGTQLFLDASLAATDALRVGAQFLYALGTDDDDEVQYTRLGNGFNGWDPLVDVGTSLSNEAIDYGNRDFDISATAFNAAGVAEARVNAGIIGGRLYTSYKAGDLKLGLSGGYFTSEEDALADVDMMVFAGGLVYNLMANTTLQLQLQYVDGEIDGPVTDGEKVDFDSFRAGTGLFVTF